MKLSQLISLSTVYVAAEGASHKGRQRRSSGVLCPTDWVQDPNDSSKCLPDAGTTDFGVSCGASSMSVTFNYNHLYENIESFLDGNSELDTETTTLGEFGNGLGGGCEFHRAGHYNGGKFTLNIDYANPCVTLLHENDEISASTLIQGSSNLTTYTDYDSGVEIHVGQVLAFGAVCSWADTETVEVGALSVTTADFSPNAGTADEGDAGYTAFVPTFTIQAFGSNDRTPVLDVADSVEIGEKVYFSISSDQTVESGGTFEWYVTDCTVYAGAAATGSYYPIIKDNSQCGSTFLDASTDSMKWQANSANSFVHLDFIAFQFAQAETGQSIHLQCDIKMCLASEDCQPTCSTCDDGYHCMSPLAA